MGNISNAVLFPAGKDLSAGSQFTQKKSAQKSAESSYQAALLKRKANAQTKEPVDPSKRFSATSAQSFSALQSDYLKSIRETRTSKKKKHNEILSEVILELNEKEHNKKRKK